MRILNVQEIVITFLGGLGIFLFGIKFMGDGLQKVAGDRLREVLDRLTSNPIMGILAGIVVTGLIQSSSATTVLTIGLVNAGFMTLKQAIGVIMGANIGTTITAFIIGIKIENYSLLFIAIGAFFIFFFKNKRMSNIGQAIFGFGALFFGLKLMGTGVSPLAELDMFTELTIKLGEQPLLGVLIGTIFTMTIQSSSAAIGLLQQLYACGAIEQKSALPVLFGDNIGTTITAVLASIGASVAARRAALTHVMFNVIGTIIVLSIFPLYYKMIAALEANLSLNPEMTLAFAHAIFNVSNTIVQAPFISVLAFIVTKLVPGEDIVVDYKAKHLDERFIGRSPSIALGQAREEVIRMGEFAEKGLLETAEYLQTGLMKHSELAKQYEEAINNLDQKINDYLIKISTRSLSKNDSRLHSMLLDSIRDIERIGDHMENIIELKDYILSNKVPISDEAMSDLKEMFELTISTVKQAMEALHTQDLELAKAVIEKEHLIDKMERTLRKKHILRVNEGICDGSAGIIFVEIVTNLERIGDHAVNIAESILDDYSEAH